MPKIKYQSFRFREATRRVIAQANTIIEEYVAQGFDLTLRQLFYQFVSRGLIANTQKDYKNLGGIINDARLAGLIDWERITDRTRNLRSLSHWDSPDEIVRAVAHQFRTDKWATQPYKAECWLEKDALVGVFEGVCNELDVPFFSCRGYTSQSEMWVASQRLLDYTRNGQIPVIFHFGDHDPSGIDMTRDIRDRLELFTGGAVRIDRLALNMDQIEEYQPPPNPAKVTDSRADAYIAIHGTESWELDALDPATLAGLVRENILAVRDEHLWDEAVQAEEEHRRHLTAVSRNWARVVTYVEDSFPQDEEE